MDLLDLLQFFEVLDGVAVGAILAAWIISGWFVENGLAGRASVSMLMADYRRDWMQQFVSREPRVFDASILDSLRQGKTFLASACMIAIGGGLALIGNTDQLLGLAHELSLRDAPVLIWELKLLLIILFTVNALLKFIWANRLFGYAR